MSEQAPERAAPAPRAGGGGGNVFTNKIGPLPMWAWVAIAAGILIVWRVYSGKSSQSSQQASADTTAANTVPQFVNQTYVSATAPFANGTAGTGTDGSSAPGTTPSPSTPTPPDQPGPTTAMPPTPTTPHPAPRPVGNIGSVTGLRASGAGATNVGLAWNAVAGAQQYQVRVTYQGKLVKTAITKGTSYNVTGLSPNRTYGLHVVAINGNQWAPETSITQKTT